MRVVRVISDLKVGGVQRQMLCTFRYLRSKGVDSCVVCQNEGGALEETFREEGFGVYVIPFRQRLDPFALWKLRRLCRSLNVDIAHGHQYQSNIACNLALVGSGVRVINSYHNLRPFYSSSQRRQARWMQGIPARFIAVSESVKAPLVECGIRPGRIRVIYNGVSVPAEPMPFVDREGGASVELVYAGRFVKQKRLPLLVDVMEVCRERGLPVHLTLLGQGPRFGRVQRRVREKGLEDYVALPGVTHDVAGWLGKSDLYITASEREGFANALLECSAAGRGFLASDIPPHQEMCGNTDAGWIVEARPEAFADVLSQICADRSIVKRMGWAAFKRVQEFSDVKTSEEYLDLYREVLGKGLERF